MNTEKTFPNWIINVANKRQASLNKQSLYYFEKIKELYPSFVSSFIAIPINVELGILKSHDPSEVSNYYQKNNPLETITFNVYETFHFVFIYQIRELAQIMEDCLTEGKFFGAAIINRSIFELVCTTYYTLRRVEQKFSECIDILKKFNKTKSTIEKGTLTKQYFEKLNVIYDALEKGNVSSSIDWLDHMQKYGLVKQESRKINRVHVSSAIEDIQKQSGMPLLKIYELMSEFVHPNYGSKALIIQTSKKQDDLMDCLMIGENKDNEEAALFYIDQNSEGLYTTLTLAITLVDRSTRLLTALNQFTENDKKILH